MLKGESSSLT